MGRILATLGICALISATACGRRAPAVSDASEARAAFQSRRPHLALIERSVLDALHGRFLHMLPSQANNLAIRRPMDYGQFSDFEQAVLVPLVRGRDVLGLSIRVNDAIATRPFHTIGQIDPVTPGHSSGSVEAARGETDGVYSIGRGQYQTLFEHSPSHTRRGDSAYHPGIDVLWIAHDGPDDIEFHVVYLTDGFRRPDAWNAPLWR